MGESSRKDRIHILCALIQVGVGGICWHVVVVEASKVEWSTIHLQVHHCVSGWCEAYINLEGVLAKSQIWWHGFSGIICESLRPSIRAAHQQGCPIPGNKGERIWGLVADREGFSCGLATRQL